MSRPRGSVLRDRVDPVGPIGNFVKRVLTSHRPRWSYDEAAEAITRQAENDGERNARFDRYNIRAWLLGSEPRKKNWKWITRAWNITIEDLAAVIDEHRTWKSRQLHAPTGSGTHPDSEPSSGTDHNDVPDGPPRADLFPPPILDGQPVTISAASPPYYVWDMRRRQFVRVAGMGLLLSAFPSLPLRLWESDPSDMQRFTPNSDPIESYWQILQQCWQLCNSGQLETVDRLIQSFLPDVLRNATDKPVSAALAAQSLRLLSVVRTHELRLHEKIALNQQGVEYARHTDDASTLVAALTELAVAFKYADQPHNSFAAYTEALIHADKASPLVRSRVYAAAAASYAQRSLTREAAKLMSRAHNAFPADPTQEPDWLLADYGVWLLAFYEGQARMFAGDHPNALAAFTSYDEHPTANLAPERNRLEILNQRARVAILTDDPDTFAICLHDSLTRSALIRSRKRMNEAMAIYKYESPRTWQSHPEVQAINDLIQGHTLNGPVSQ
ncbi:MAG: hypothetical protein E6J41_29355 [Chloroflexi bacterium]|nr:MAG: hypothetical protein E6J41_29355 [Chloroflexota bacterium]